MTQTDAGHERAQTSDLVAFLRARFQDDWNHARDAMMGNGEWRAERTVVVLDSGAEIPEVYLGQADHIARFDPARILAEVEAKRAVVDAYEGAQANTSAEYGEGLRRALGLLASVYADHADHRAEWRAS
ncbi:DUF6221 family protein [Streptomyces sp. NPDC001514]